MPQLEQGRIAPAEVASVMGFVDNADEPVSLVHGRIDIFVMIDAVRDVGGKDLRPLVASLEIISKGLKTKD